MHIAHLHIEPAAVPVAIPGKKRRSAFAMKMDYQRYQKGLQKNKERIAKIKKELLEWEPIYKPNY